MMSVFSRISFRRITSLRPKTSLKTQHENQLKTIKNEFQGIGGGNVDLSIDHNTGVGVICFDNPDRKNSLSGKMMSQFSDVINVLEGWPQGKAVVILGSDQFFCSGGDLNTVRQIANPVIGRKMSLLMHDNCTRLQSLPLISLALVEGMAIGGGAEIATSCDFRLFTRDSQIGFVHILIGIVSAWGGGARLSQLIGPQRALDLMLTGRKVRANEALAIGLADAVLEESDDSIVSAKQWLNKYTKNSVNTVRAVKKIVNGSRYLPLQLALEDEVEHSTSVWGGDEHRSNLKKNIKHK